MKSRITATVLFLAFLLLVLPSPAKEKPGTERKGLSKTTAGQPYVLMNANNVTTWAHSDGFFNWLVQQSWNGEYPKSSGVGTIFSEGIVFGGFVQDGLFTNTLRVTGDTYFIGMQPGAIHADGSVDNIDAPDARAFGVRPDMPPSLQNNPAKWPDLTVDAATFLQIPQASIGDADKAQIAAQYITDWKEWPASKGAPWFIDTVKTVRNDAAFDPTNPHHIPGIPGASKTIWYVCNDLNTAVTQTFAGSPPIGMEEQMTLWAYASSTPLNNIIFKQVKLIYKGNPGAPANSRIDSMYVVQWADPDNGDSGDDYAGSDSTLNLNYDWNSKTVDAKYAAVGLPAAATGYVFLQGAAQYTGVATDSAVVNFRWQRGYKYFLERNGVPTPLSSACYFAAGSPISDPDAGAYSGTQQWYNLMRGDLPRPAYPAGTPFWQSSDYAKAHNIVTNYILPGDPVTGSGWIDGYDIAAGDRRLVTTHGPFTMKLKDTAEVVLALVDGTGADNLSSVKVLKYNTTYAQFAFNSNFNLPSAPPNPKVSVSPLDRKVVLNWAGDLEAVTADETSDNNGFAFEGYNVYQLPSASASLDAGVRIATYDLVDNVTVIVAPKLDINSGVIVTAPVQFGSDKGISRNIDITTDYIKQRPLVNGQVYYYAVTAYSYNPNWNNTSSIFQAPFPSLESSPVVLTAIPAAPSPGVRYAYNGGDALPVTHTNSVGGAVSDGHVTAVVVQPDQMNGHNYQVLFDTVGGWRVVDATNANTVVLTGTNQSGDANYLTAGGVQVIVQGPQPGMKEWSITGTRHFSPVGGFTGLGLEGFVSAGDPTAYDPNNGTIGMARAFAFGGIGTTLQSPAQYHTVLLQLAAVNFTTLWDPLVAPTDTNFSKGYRWLRRAGAPAEPQFAPWIINTGSGYPYQDFNYSVPFSAWDMDVNPPQRLTVGMFENNVVNGKVDGRYWPPTASATAGVDDNTVAREFCFIFDKPYSTTDDPTFHVNISGNSSLPMMWVMVCSIRNTSNWASGDAFTITAAKVNGPNDVFSYTATAPTYSKTTAQADINQINVFPNPYYGFNSSETNRLNKYVRFSHLPPGSTIRIFSLAGVLVKTLPVTDASSTYADWNLRNDNSLPVASGIYIAYIDMPNLGKTKTLKIAIVQEEQILPTY